MQDTVADVNELFAENESGKKEMQKLAKSVRDMTDEVAGLKKEVDRLEGFSRRDNIRMFGVPAAGDSEDYDTCAKAVTDVLNSVEGTKEWTPDDIARAHRVGQSRNDGPRPMIVKFSKWKDKITIITNKDFRKKLKDTGVTIANDLTRQQASIAAEAKKEGKVAFFKKGQFIVQPRQPDSRTYAEVTATDTRETAKEQATPHQADDRAKVRGDNVSNRRVNGDSPSSNLSTSQLASNTRSPRATHEQTGSRQPGMQDFFNRSVRKQCNTVSSPVNKTPGKDFPRRPDRHAKKP